VSSNGLRDNIKLIFLKKGGVFKEMVNIKVREGESIEEAIRRFKRDCERNGIMQEIKKREFYKAPSVLKKERIAETKRKIRRKMLKDNRWTK
jgi:small subunit ribosomal protein S21